MRENTTGSFNTAIGSAALRENDTGGNNTAIGAEALLSNTDGVANTAVGDSALHSNITAAFNTAVGAFALYNNEAGANNAFGFQALFENITGDFNNAHGRVALLNNMDGIENNAFGDRALRDNVSGSFNTAIGGDALIHCKGSFNTAVGSLAGLSQQTGSGNVYIGDEVLGVAGESNHTYIRNIKDTIVSGGGTDFVSVNLTTGLLGHVSSSRRYKEDIKSMDKTSELLYELKPVTYRFKKEIDPSQSLEYGLVAEEVAQVNPNLAIRDGKGQIESVRYTAINAMLLNEFLKEHRKVQELEANAARQQKQIEALTAGLQKVSAQLEASEPAPQVVNNP